MRPRPLTPLLALAFAIALIASAGVGVAATGSTVVAATVVSATTLSTTGCPPLDPTRTSFGNVLPGASLVTSADCDVLFGSSNDTATLRTYQPDGRGMAMAAATTTLTGVGSSLRMLDVDMADANVGWAVGEGSASSRMYKTVDGGVTWTAVSDANDGLNGSAEGVDAVSATLAWASRANGNELARTTDGSIWTTITMTAFPTASVNKVIAWDATRAWAAGSETIAGNPYGRIWYTSDGGATWTLAWSSAAPNSEATEGVALGPTQAYVATTDSAIGVAATTTGTSFAPLQNFPATTASDVDAFDANNVVSVSSTGRIQTTQDGGLTWIERTNMPIDLSWQAVDVRPSGIITAASYDGMVVRSTDWGATWTLLDQDVEGGRIYALDGGSDSQIVLAFHSATIATSLDAGVSWSVNAAATNTNWTSVDGIDAGRLWRVGGRGAIQTSTDGASTWSAQPSGTSELLQDVLALSRTMALVVGSDGTILRTTNAGSTWTQVGPGTGVSFLTAAAAPDGVTVWVGAADGSLRRSTDAGLTWSTVASGVTTPIMAIAPMTAQSVLIGSMQGTVRTTLDGGVTWTTRNPPLNDGVTAGVAVPGTSTAFIVDEDDVSKTTDGGATWTRVDVTTTGVILDMDRAPDGTLWTVGHYGRVDRSIDDGATWTSYTGGSTTRTGRAIVGFSADTAISAFDGNYVKIPAELTPVPDYDGAAASWTGSGFFGMCLRAAPATTPSWTTDGTCDVANSGEWRALPRNGGLASAPVASTLAPGTTTASFRFGMKVPASQAAGSYRAAITFEVTAPSG